MRFIDVSLAVMGILQENADGRRKLVSLEDGHSLLPDVVVKAPWARLTEDGTKLLAVEADPEPEPGYPDPIFAPWFSDLRTGRQQRVGAWPSLSASGTAELIRRYRRNAIQLGGSRVVVAFADIRNVPNSEDVEKSNLVVVREGIGGGYDSADCLAADVDNELRTVVVAKADRSERSRGRVDVYARLRHFEWDARATAGWPIDVDSFRGIWLSPEGSRVILRTEHRGEIRHGVWSTASGRYLGDVPLRGECFGFSPDGKLVGDKRGDALTLMALP